MYKLSKYCEDICWYILHKSEGGSIKSALSYAGMPKVTGDPHCVIRRTIKIGRALDAVTEKQRKLTGQKIEQNVLIERWSAYLAEKAALRSLKNAKLLANLALSVYNHNPSDENFERLAEVEEQLIQLNELLNAAKLKNSRIRRSKLYAELLEFYIEKMN